MRNSVSPSTSGTSSLPLLILAIWGFLAFVFFLLFSIPDPVKGYPDWYAWGTSIFELVAFFVASLLCFRNAFSPQIASSRSVWLFLGLGMGFYFVGTIFFTFWENVLKRDVEVSPGDLFFILTYLCLALALGLALINRRLNLEPIQWVVVAIMTAVGVLIAMKLQTDTPKEPKASLWVEPTKVALLAEVSPMEGTLFAQATPVKPTPAVTPAAKKTTPPAKVAPTKAAPVKAVPAAEEAIPAPAWVEAIEKSLQPIKPVLGLFYVVMDLVLLVGSTMLLLAFWGGKFAQSWRMIAAAIFCLYLADVWFKYATDHIRDYQSGSFLEVGWVLCGVLFGIGALLEYNVSMARRNTSRRRA